MLSPADDLPIHQIAQPVAVVGTTDRNFYDRYYFFAHHCGDGPVLVAGMGQYPNLGVADGFLAVTYEGRQEVLRCSRELEADRLDTSVGPLAVEVLAGLESLRVRVEPNRTGIEADLLWTSRIPAYLEPRHINRNGPRVTTDSVRFCQTGYWSGHVRIDDRQWDLDDGAWWGVRDRSWGIRPVGDPEPAGRRYSRTDPGLLWLYGVLQFEDRTIVVIVQEDAEGRRSLDHAVCLSGEGTEDLGRVQHELEIGAGTREVVAARLSFGSGSAVEELEVVPVAASYLSLGTGYGTEPEWRHGMHQGPSAEQRRSFDLSDPAQRKGSYGLVDSVGRARAGGAVGYGLFEYAVLGRNDRYGFGTRRTK